MKRLTINDIAKASLRTGKRAYLSLAIGIFLSIFLITGVVMTAVGYSAAFAERTAQDVGYQNFFLLDDTETADSYLMESGMFDRIGHVYITACVTDTTRYLGCYDEEGEALLNRRMEAGRMPEKAGEIALEKSALENLRIEAEVGDVIELDLTAVDGVRETRAFTITGFLNEQTLYLSQPRDHGQNGTVAYFPAILVHPDEPAFAAGRTVVHRLLTKNENVPTAMVMQRFTDWRSSSGLDNFFCIYSRDEIYDFAPIAFYLDQETIVMYAMIAVCALALLTATGTGIAQSMESRLAQKREEIGMLRAVGATKRQIRKIFGREAWMLALILSPISVAGGCAFAWVLSLIAPEFIVFSLNWRLLIPIIIFSALCILVSASLPLRRASKIYPMSVIRDTELLRKSRAIRPKKQFKAPRLISGRQLRLYPTRQIGAMVLVVMMLVCIALASTYLDTILGTQSIAAYDFYMGCYWGRGYANFIEVMPLTTITLQDINQVAAIEQVDRVKYISEQDILLLKDVDGLPEYVAYMERYGFGNDHLDEEDEQYPGSVDQYKLVREMFDIETDVIKAMIVIADSRMVADQAEFVADGRIDLTAINAGREVIVCAPDIYVYEEESENGMSRSTYYAEPGEWEKEPYDRVLRNELFFAGDSLDMMQLYHYQNDVDQIEYSESRYQEMYAAAESVKASVTIGAVLSDDSMNGVSGPMIITTWEGAQAMGLKIISPQTYIYLSGNMDEETEAYVQKRLETIAVRGEDVQVRNYLEIAREQRRQGLSLLLACLCAAVVFLAVAVSMIAGNIRRRIMADKRMIGTLRAVGADRKALIGCYGGQVESAVGAGLVIALGLYAWLATLIYRYNTAGAARDVPVAVGIMFAFAGICYLACRTSLKRSIGEVMKKSIVENIREL